MQTQSLSSLEQVTMLFKQSLSVLLCHEIKRMNFVLHLERGEKDVRERTWLMFRSSSANKCSICSLRCLKHPTFRGKVNSSEHNQKSEGYLMIKLNQPGEARHKLVCHCKWIWIAHVHSSFSSCRNILLSTWVHWKNTVNNFINPSFLTNASKINTLFMNILIYDLLFSYSKSKHSFAMAFIHL